MTAGPLQVGEEPPPLLSDDEIGRKASQQAKPKGKTKTAKGRTAKRFGLLNAFVDFTMASLKPSERAVWFVLFRDTKPNGIASTSEKDIGRRAGIRDRMVRYALTALAKRGLVEIVRRGGLRSGPSAYRVFGLEPERV